MIYNRLLPLLVPLIIFCLFEAFLLKPKIIYLSVVISLSLILFVSRQFFSSGSLKRGRWSISIFPALAIISFAAYSTIIPSRLVMNLLFILLLAILYIYLRTLYYYLIQPELYAKGLSIEIISSYGNFVNYFLASSYLFGLASFLDFPIWPLMIIILFISFFAIFEELWAKDINPGESLVFIIIGALILLEIGWSISFLPINYNIAGLILAICYYMAVGLLKYYILNKLDKKIIRFYLTLGFFSIFVLLLTSRWF